MASDNSFKLQANFKLRVAGQDPRQDALLNIYANDGDDLNAQLDALIENLPKISQVDELLRAAEAVVNTPPSQGYPQQQNVQQQPAQGQSGGREMSAPPNEAPPVCSHGQYEWRHRISPKTGNAYKGWFCVANDKAHAAQFRR
jgi:hypothetical protein